MRQVFSSPRLENVEAVAQMLRDQGIEVRITNGRSYKGNRRGTFSYRETHGAKPAVWVVKSDDQVRAREILREAGLMQSTRTPGDSYLAPTFRASDDAPVGNPTARRAFRIKLALLAAIALTAAAMMTRLF
ncbi:MAG TPA: pathogenicity-like protein [Lysobacter sp.]|nr:pathogenicity-like protein [Lysobacter sp.]